MDASPTPSQLAQRFGLRTPIVSPTLDARRLYGLARPLDDLTCEDLQAIPGVEPWYHDRTIVSAPVNAAAAVAEILRARGFEDGASSGLIGDELAHEGDCGALVTAAISWRDTSGRDVWSWNYDHQRRCVEHAIRRGGGHVWACPGSGKTAIAVEWAMAAPGAILIVTRAAARLQWRRNLADLLAGETVPHALRPPSTRRKRDRSLAEYVGHCRSKGLRPVLVVGWEQARDHYLEILNILAPQSVVWDESHVAKATRRERWTMDQNDRMKGEMLPNISAAAWEIAKRVPRRLATTATPVYNRLSDLWAQLTLVEPWAWGRTANRFLRRYCDARQGVYGWDASGMSHLDELRPRLQHTAIQIPYAESHGSLPPKRRLSIFVDREAQTRGLQGHKREMSKLEKSQDPKARAKLQQLRLVDAALRKRAVLKDTVRDYMGVGKGKIIVFTGQVEDCEAIAKTLRTTVEAAGQLHVIHGAISQRERAAIQDAYMASDGPAVIVGTYYAMGASLDFQDTDAILFGMLPYEPGMYEQAEGRGDRLGMQRPLTYLYLVATGTVDERIIATLDEKMTHVEGAAGGGRLDGLGAALMGLDDQGIEDALDALADRLIGGDENG